MKIIFFLFISIASFAQEKIQPHRVDYKEARLKEGSDDVFYENLRNVKNQEVDNFLMDNPAIKECKQKAGGDQANFADDNVSKAVRDCFKDKLEQLTPEQISKLSTDLNLVGYGVIKDNSIPTIKNYFDDRLGESLYGKKKEGKSDLLGLRDQNFVTHETFLSLYEAQISKTSLKNISEFCLKYEYKVNCSERDTDVFKCFTTIQNDKLTYDKIKIQMEQKKQAQLKEQWKGCALTIEKVCTAYSEKTNKNETKSTEFENTADLSSLGADQKEMARHACLIVKSLKDQREATVEIDKQKEEYKNLKSEKGINISSTFKGVYSDQNSTNKSIDEITTLSSTEIADQHDFTEDQKNATECASSGNSESDACKNFFKVVENKDQEKLVLDYELKAMAQIKKFNNEVKDLKDKELEDYLKSKGNETLIKDLDSGASADDIRAKLELKFRAERMAIVNQLREKIKATEITKSDTNTATKLSNVEQSVKEQQERLRGIYHYTNIVSSYLSLTDNSSGKETVNTVGINAEKNNYKESNADDYFKDLVPQNLNSNSGTGKADFSIMNVDFIDQLLNQEETNKKDITTK